MGKVSAEKILSLLVDLYANQNNVKIKYQIISQNNGKNEESRLE